MSDAISGKAACTAAFILAAFLLVTASAAAPVISEFCPDTYLSGGEDEYFVLSGTGTLDGIYVTDGEGSVSFPPGSRMPAHPLVTARNASAYILVHGEKPDYELTGTDPSVPDAVMTGRFQMSNSEDSLALVINGKTVQEVSYPSADLKSGKGRVHKLDDETGLWDVRDYYLLQTDFEPAVFYDTTVTAYVSPDSSYEVISDAAASAKNRINLNVYELTSPAIADMLGSASERGVTVKILLEGSPTGGFTKESDYAAMKLKDSGADVFLEQTQNGIYHTPYRFNHAKYMTIDGKGLIIQSENFGTTGVPQTGFIGNRGFGAYIQDEGAANYFDEVFETDVSAGWVSSYAPSAKKVRDAAPESESGDRITPRFEPETFTGVNVIPVISPENSGLILKQIKSAQRTIDIEQAYINDWESGTNPYLAAALEAAKRGVKVRILLDSYYFNVEGDDDNDEMAAEINKIAADEGLDVTAALCSPGSMGVIKIHNKCVIVDSESVLVSSVNWNENSPQRNREAGVILSGGSIGEYYQRVFDYDWEKSTTKGFAAWSSASNDGADISGIAKCAAAVIVILLFAGLYIYRKRRL